jgi:hypothetical protein
MATGRRTKLNKKKRRIRRRYTRKTKGGGEPPKVTPIFENGLTIYNLYNQYHYGDNLLNLKFLYNISNVLKENKIFIRYYYNDDYIKKVEELSRYVNKESVDLISMKNMPPTATEITMDGVQEGPSHKTGIHNISSDISVFDFDKFYSAFYDRILKIIGLSHLPNIDRSLFQKEDYLGDIYNKLDSKFKDIDILIINAEPHSGQFTYDKEKIDNMCINLSKKHNIVTTTPVIDSIKCTMRDGLFLQDIGAVSTHAKYIISVHSGPIVPCYNLMTKNHVKKWIVLVNHDYKMNDVDTVIIKSCDHLGDIEKHLT